MRSRSRGVWRNRQVVRCAAVDAVRRGWHGVEPLEGRVLLSVVKFGAEVNSPVGSDPTAVAAADVNGDGKMDLLVANYATYNVGTVSVLLGNGNGTFKPEQEFTAGTGPESVVVGDFNGDNKMDLAVTDEGQAAVAILAGNGNGTFGAPTFISVGSSPTRIAITDVNLDQKPDLFVTYLASANITELLGNGNGTFLQSQLTLATGVFPNAITATDLTNDNRPDLIVTIGSKSTVGVMTNLGAGHFSAPVTFDAGINPNAIGLGDLNADGFTDLAIPNASGGANYVSVLLGNGNGTFRARATFAVGDTAPPSLAVADFNGDGKLDLAVADYNSKQVAILLNDGTGSFLPPQQFPTASNPSAVAAPDLDGDGKPDVVAVHGYANSVGTMLNTSQPFVVSINRKQPTSTTTSVQVVNFTVTFSAGVIGVDAGDFAVGGGGVSGGPITVTPVSASVYTVTVSGVSGNGRLALNLVDNGTIHDLSGRPLQTIPLSFQPQQTLAIGPYSRQTVAADVNGDGKMDIVTCSTVGTVLLGNGNGTFKAPLTFADGPTPYGFAVADVNGDGKPDVVVTNYYGSYTGKVNVLLGNGNGTFQARHSFAVGQQAPTKVIVADVSGDGKPDLIINSVYQTAITVNYSTTYFPAYRNIIMLGNGNGTFAAPTTPAFGLYENNSSLAVPVDINGDGKMDLILDGKRTPTGSGEVAVMLGNGNGTFAAQHTFSLAVGGYPQSLYVTDVNGDGKKDVIATVGGAVSVLLGNGNGTFNAAAVSAFPYENGPGVVVDVNGDGKPDVVAPTNYGVGVMLGGGTAGFFQSGPSFVTRASSTAVEVADFTGDGKPDVLQGYYVGTSSENLLLLAGGTAGIVSGQPYTIVPPVDSVTGGTGNDTMTLTRDLDGVDIDMTMNSLTTQFPINDSHGLTFVGNGGNDVINLNYANGNPLPNLVHLNGTFTINGLTGVSPLASTQLEIGQSTVYFSYAGTSPAAAIAAALQVGYNGGAWNGSGGGVITSNAAAGGAPGAFGVGYADSADGVVTGQPANTVEIRYTVMGDANLDRVVNSTDALLLARDYEIVGRTNWDQGNFNFDTTINLSDAQILQKNYNQTASGSVTPGADWTSASGGTVATSVVQEASTGNSSSITGDAVMTKLKKHHPRRRGGGSR